MTRLRCVSRATRDGARTESAANRVRIQQGPQAWSRPRCASGRCGTFWVSICRTAGRSVVAAPRTSTWIVPRGRVRSHARLRPQLRRKRDGAEVLTTISVMNAQAFQTVHKCRNGQVGLQTYQLLPAQSATTRNIAMKRFPKMVPPNLLPPIEIATRAIPRLIKPPSAYGQPVS